MVREARQLLGRWAPFLLLGVIVLASAMLHSGVTAVNTVCSVFCTTLLYLNTLLGLPVAVPDVTSVAFGGGDRRPPYKLYTDAFAEGNAIAVSLTVALVAAAVICGERVPEMGGILVRKLAAVIHLLNRAALGTCVKIMLVMFLWLYVCKSMAHTAADDELHATIVNRFQQDRFIMTNVVWSNRLSEMLSGQSSGYRFHSADELVAIAAEDGQDLSEMAIWDGGARRGV